MKTRIIGPAGSCYHVFSRIIERRFYLGGVEKEAFCSLLRRVAQFSGVNILTYCVLDNHFHILVQVPERVEVDDVELLRRLKLLYGTERKSPWGNPVQEFELSVDKPMVRQALRAKYWRRMYDLSEFMRTLKLRFSFWYNRKHDREGTLWDMRFKSVLVQGPHYGVDRGTGNLALSLVAAYIDLNSVRAGIVEDPVEYRWCGYAAAVAGNRGARYGLGYIYGVREGQIKKWSAVDKVYRTMLLLNAGKNDGNLVAVRLLRARIRYFTRGGVLGCRTFVDRVFAENRDQFSPKRRRGALQLQGGDWKGLCAIRQVGRS
jgi:hypothetical protein